MKSMKLKIFQLYVNCNSAISASVSCASPFAFLIMRILFSTDFKKSDKLITSSLYQSREKIIQFTDTQSIKK